MEAPHPVSRHRDAGGKNDKMGHIDSGVLFGRWANYSRITASHFEQAKKKYDLNYLEAVSLFVLLMENTENLHRIPPTPTPIF